MGNCVSCKQKIKPTDDVIEIDNEGDYYGETLQDGGTWSTNKLEQDFYSTVLKKEKSMIGYYNRPGDLQL